MGQGQDQTLIYMRKQEKVEYKKGKYPFDIRTDEKIRWGSKDFSFHTYIVGFCGNIYPVVKIHKHNHWEGSVEEICFDQERVDAFIETNFKKKQFEAYKSKNHNRHWVHWQRQDKFKKFFKWCEENKNKFGHMFQEKRCPIFVASRPKITWNGCLKDLQFVRKFDPFTAFQEISMYLGAIAVPQKPLPKIPDKIMIGAKGFDKWSFRKPPEKK